MVLCSLFQNGIIIGSAGAPAEAPVKEPLIDTVGSPLLPIIVQEDVFLRGESEKHFLCDDGSYIAVSYPSAVHEKQGNAWVEIDYPLTVKEDRIQATDRCQTPEGDVMDTAVSLAATMKAGREDDLVRFRAGDAQIGWTVGVARSPAALQKTIPMIC